MAIYKVINEAGDYRNIDAVERVLSYITSPRKVQPDGIFGGFVVPEFAALSMDTVMDVFHNDTGPRLRHCVLSFSPDEGLSPAEVKKIASKAIEYYEDQYQIVAAVHEDREHLHIHFGMNTTNYLDGSKYHGEKKDYYGFINLLNTLTKPYGIHVKPED